MSNPYKDMSAEQLLERVVSLTDENTRLKSKPEKEPFVLKRWHGAIMTAVAVVILTFGCTACIQYAIDHGANHSAMAIGGSILCGTFALVFLIWSISMTGDKELGDPLS